MGLKTGLYLICKHNTIRVNQPNLRFVNPQALVEEIHLYVLKMMREVIENIQISLIVFVFNRFN